MNAKTIIKIVEDWISENPKQRGAFLALGESKNDEKVSSFGTIGGSVKNISAAIFEGMNKSSHAKEIIHNMAEVSNKMDNNKLSSLVSKTNIGNSKPPKN